MSFFGELRETTNIIRDKMHVINKVKDVQPTRSTTLFKIVQWKESVQQFKNEVIQTVDTIEKDEHSFEVGIQKYSELIHKLDLKTQDIEMFYSKYGYTPLGEQDADEQCEGASSEKQTTEATDSGTAKKDLNKENIPVTPKYRPNQTSPQYPILTGNYSAKSKHSSKKPVFSKNTMFEEEFTIKTAPHLMTSTPTYKNFSRPYVNSPQYPTLSSNYSTNAKSIPYPYKYVSPMSCSRYQPLSEVRSVNKYRPGDINVPLVTPASNRIRLEQSADVLSAYKSIKNRFKKDTPDLADFGLEEYKEETECLTDMIKNCKPTVPDSKTPELADFGLSEYQLPSIDIPDTQSIKLPYRKKRDKSPDLADFGLEAYKEDVTIQLNILKYK